jgi:hypothetical protein
MSDVSLDLSVREALFDLQRYLSDQLAPMMMTESMEVLLEHPPQLVAREIQSWVGAQYRGPRLNVAVSDFLYHALKKIHMMSEFELIDQKTLSGYLDELAQLVLGLCPEAERDRLRRSLARLGESEAHLTPPVDIVHRQMSNRKTQQRSNGSVDEDVSRGLRRFSLLVERLEQGAPADLSTVGVPGDGRGALMAQALASAAFASRTGSELESNLHRLGELGLDSRPEHVFTTLGRSLPGWVVPVAWMDGTAAAPMASNPSVRAMHRIISVAEDPDEGAKRFKEMLQAAVERFNEGSLVQAMTMFDLAERIISEKKLSSAVVKSIRDRAHNYLSFDQLRKYAEKPEKHETLRKVLSFFPALTVKGLLDALNGEKRRDLRKLRLALLEVHGAEARAEVFERLIRHVGGAFEDPQGFYLRNLVYLLRRIPRPADAPVQQELDLLIPLSKAGTPSLVVKEVVGALGGIKNVTAEKTLMDCLQKFEKMNLSQGKAPYTIEELTALLDRTASTLARYGTQNANRTVVNHALLPEPALGNPMARLDELENQDLSDDKELVSLLVGTLRDELPKKVLGLTVQKGSEKALHLVRGLAGTPTPAVLQILEEIVRKYPDQPFGKAASDALDGFGAKKRSAEAPGKALSGDLELFGLPNLLQSLADSRVTGILNLSGFEEGKVRSCRAGQLRGEPALYQLFEKPLPGTFTFQACRDGLPEKEAHMEPLEVLPVVLEALRRHDEFQQARVIVPDDIRLKPSGSKPTRPADEKDKAFLYSVWSKITSGVTAAKCESSVVADSYRIRRVLAHWVEEGALKAA